MPPMPAAAFPPMDYPAMLPTTVQSNQGHKQPLIDNLNQLLKSIEQNKQWIESFDTHLDNQNQTMDSLRSDLVSVSDSNTSMRTTHSIEVDVESLILTSVTQPHGTNVELCDFDDAILKESELFSYLIDRERTILKLQSHLATANNLSNHIPSYGNHGNIHSNYGNNGGNYNAEWYPSHMTQDTSLEDHYLKKYWALSERNKQLTALVKELRDGEDKLKEELSEQQQLTSLYSFLYHISINYSEVSVLGHRSSGISSFEQHSSLYKEPQYDSGVHDTCTQTPSFIWVPTWDQGSKQVSNTVQYSVSCQTSLQELQYLSHDTIAEPVETFSNNSELTKVVAHVNALQSTVKKQEENYSQLQFECRKIMQSHETIVKDRVHAVENYYADFFSKKEQTTSSEPSQDPPALLDAKGEDAEEESGPKKDIASPRKDMASPRKDITLQDDPTSDVETVPPKGCKNDGYNSNKEMGYTSGTSNKGYSSAYNTSVSELQSSTDADSNVYDSRKISIDTRTDKTVRWYNNYSRLSQEQLRRARMTY